MKKDLWIGLIHSFVSFTSIAVVASILGVNLVLAFLFAGVGTIVFHLVTKNQIPSVLGLSGLFIGGLLYVGQTYGMPYVFGGIIIAGLVYIVFGLIMLKFQDQVMKLFPDWLLSMVILLIAFSLIPIGLNLATSNLLVALVAIATTALVDIFGHRNMKPFAMPLGIVVATIVASLTGSVSLSVAFTPIAIDWVMPKFGMEAMLTLGMIALVVLFEMLGDIKNTSSIVGKDLFKEVGVGRISIGNGLATLFGGFGNASCYTTYAENNAFLMQTKHYSPTTQIFTGIFFMLFAFITPLHSLVASLPVEAFGGVLVYLYSMVAINAIRNIVNSGVDLNKNERVFGIMTVMLAVSMFTFTIMGISISSVAISAIVGIVLNTVFNRKKDKDEGKS